MTTLLENFFKSVPKGNANKRLNYCIKEVENVNKHELFKEVQEIIQSSDEYLIIRYLAGIIHKCPVCGTYFYKRGVKTCSKECAKIEHLRTTQKTCIEKYGTDNPLKSKEIRDKIKETNLKKYGVEYISQAKEIKDKVQKTNLERYGTKSYTQSTDYKIKNAKTCLEKYGVKNVFQNEDIKNKIKQTNLKKYGVEHNTQNEDVKNKAKATFLEKYGNSNYLLSDDFKNKSIKTNLKKYGVENPLQSKIIQGKIKQTNLKKYGVENYTQTPEFLDKLRKSCFEKYGNEIYQRTEDYKFKSVRTNIKKYGAKNYSQSKQKHIKDLEKLLKTLKDTRNNQDLTSKYLEQFTIIQNNLKMFDVEGCKQHFNVSYATVLRIKKCFDITYPNYCEKKSCSDAERKLFNWIPCNNKFSNDRKVIAPYELDIVLPDYKLAIEYNGVYWHSDFYKDENYHLEKTLKCQNQGYQLFHIFESDDIDIWKSMIYNKLGLSNKIYARKCLVKEIPNKDAKNFCLQNHLQGACNAKINLGLFYNDTLVEVMTFGKPRYNKHYQYELLRLCSLKYTSVVGGATKLWKFFLQKYCPNSVISYANRRFSNGSIYETLGFKFLNETKPNYWYVKDDNVLSRVQCQKHKLKSFLESFDENLSEVDNMLNNGYVRFFDCGNLVYSFEENT